jgi:hypothetical protein
LKLFDDGARSMTKRSDSGAAKQFCSTSTMV